jgi:hypothetical protein
MKDEGSRTKWGRRKRADGNDAKSLPSAFVLHPHGEGRPVILSGPSTGNCSPSLHPLRHSVTRIFSTLAIISTLLLLAAYWMGLSIGNILSPASTRAFTAHFLTGVGAIMFAILVHSLVLTYFMGTGRWLEETCHAYRLGDAFPRRNRDLKWRVLPFLGTCVLLLVVTGGFGAAADPGASVHYAGSFGLSAAGVHQLTATLMLTINVAVYVGEYVALRANAEIVNAVLAEVKRMREERGLPV